MIRNKRKITEKNLLYYTVLFVLIVIVGYYPLWRSGRSLIWKVDGVGQYYPSFLYIGMYIRRVARSVLRLSPSLPMFDLSIGMGEDIIGSLNYYGFGDPVNLLAVFANQNNGAYVYTFCCILRMWLSGAAFYGYCRSMKLEGEVSVIGALCYAFSGFAVYGGARYGEWISVLIYFPLMLSGAERLFKDQRRPGLFVFSVAYGALCGFYFLYMSSLALALYFAIRLVTIHSTAGKIQIGKSVLCGIFWYIIGILTAAPVLLPSVAAYFNSERSGGANWARILDVSVLLPSFKRVNAIIKSLTYVHSGKLGYMSGAPLTELLAIAMLPFLPNARRRRQLGIAWIISLCLMSIPFTGYLFNAFGENNSRWVFLIHALSALTFVVVLQEGVTALWRRNLHYRIQRKKQVLVTIGILTVSNIAFFIHFAFGVQGINWQKKFVKWNSAIYYTSSPYWQSDVISDDTEWFRVGSTTLTKVNGRPENIAMINRYYGNRYWFSIANSAAQKYVNSVIGKNLKWRSYGTRIYPAANTFLGVKYYMVSKKKYAPSGFRRVEKIRFNGKKWYVYQNPDYFGMACFLPVERMDSDAGGDLTEMSLESWLPNVSTDGLDALDYSSSRGQVTCTTRLKEPARLMLLIPYHKNWSAEVDGKRSDVLQSETGMVTIRLSEGVHEVKLKYISREFQWGVFLMIVGIGCVFFCYRRSRQTGGAGCDAGQGMQLR